MAQQVRGGVKILAIVGGIMIVAVSIYWLVS